jgi:hypothetical protein
VTEAPAGEDFYAQLVTDAERALFCSEAAAADRCDIEMGENVMKLEQRIRYINALAHKHAKGEDKQEQYLVVIGQHIAAIKQEHPKNWQSIVEERCRIGRSRSYELIQIGTGKKTIERLRLEKAESVRRVRDARPLRSGQKDGPAKLPLGALRRPLADCPICEGTGLLPPFKLTSECGRLEFDGEPMSGACPCVQWEGDSRTPEFRARLQGVREDIEREKAKPARAGDCKTCEGAQEITLQTSMACGTPTAKGTAPCPECLPDEFRKRFSDGMSKKAVEELRESFMTPAAGNGSDPAAAAALEAAAQEEGESDADYRRKVNFRAFVNRAMQSVEDSAAKIRPADESEWREAINAATAAKVAWTKAVDRLNAERRPAVSRSPQTQREEFNKWQRN